MATPWLSRGTGGLVDGEVHVEHASLDEGVPAILREDARGVRIAVDWDQGPDAVTRALAALLSERFACDDWQRNARGA